MRLTRADRSRLALCYAHGGEMGGGGMEPLSVAMLVALASGLGGAAGTEAWQRLSDLVCRPFQRSAARTTHPDDEELVSSQRALHGLQSHPDVATAQALLNALGRRSASDPDFAHALAAWAAQTPTANISVSEVRNVVSGGTQGTVLQVRDINGSISLGAPSNPISDQTS